MRACRTALTIVFVLVGSILACAGRVGPIVVLPGQPAIQAATQDSAGNWYVAGSIPPSSPKTSADTSDVFVAKISSNGTILYSDTFGSGRSDSAIAIAVTTGGSLLVIGQAGAADFPVTPNAAQPTPTDGCSFTCFFARLDTNGNLVYASFLGTNASGLVTFDPKAIAVDSTGAAYITGQGIFNSTPGALPPNGFEWFTLKLDPTGKLSFGTGLIGGTAIALDNQGFIYVAGAAAQEAPLPVTAGAFQTATPPLNECGSAGLTGFSCTHQYVAKLDPTASTLLYTTWLSGSYNESVNALVIDNAGNVIVAGSTGSSDYPVTPGAYQTTSYATNPPRDYPEISLPHGGNRPGPPQTGYVTKLNATGASLIFSTFLGGSQQDAINSMILDASGRMYLGGITASPDFPGLFPDGCRPSAVYATPFLTRLDSDGSSISATQLAYGLTAKANNGGLLPTGGVASNSQGNGVAFLGSIAAGIDLSALSTPLSCIADAADGGPLAQVAPGQLLSLFGDGLGQSFPPLSAPQGGPIPTALGDRLSVTFNGVAAPILYSSGGQVNLQVPYEIAGQSSVAMKIQYCSTSLSVCPFSGHFDTFNFPVVASQPANFLTSSTFAVCGSITTLGVSPLASNADGTPNSCSNRAVQGSLVQVYLNGLGLAGGSPATGAINSSSAAPLTVPATATFSLTSLGNNSSVFPPETIVKTVEVSTDPGQVNSVWVATIDTTNLTDTNEGTVRFTLSVGGVATRDPVVVWMKPANSIPGERGLKRR